MKNLPLFTTTIWKSELPEFENLENKFLEEIKKFRENNPISSGYSNVNGYESPNGIHTIKEFSPLFDYVAMMANQACEDLNFIDRNIAITSSWVNIADSRSSMNNYHTHEHTFSGVFYLKVPKDSGKLCIRNDAINPLWDGNKLIQQKTSTNASSVKIEPVEGEITLFPSYLPHSVETNLHDDERISISFNIIAFPKSE